jgi:hypothetical protein
VLPLEAPPPTPTSVCGKTEPEAYYCPGDLEAELEGLEKDRTLFCRTWSVSVSRDGV